MTETSPMPGRAYTPEQVYENGWLGDIKPSAMRNAVSHGDWPCTKVRGKVCFTAEHIAQIIADGEEAAKKAASPAKAKPRRTPSRPPADLPAGVSELKPRPEDARRSRRKAS